MKTADRLKIEFKRQRTHANGLTDDGRAEAIGAVLDELIHRIDKIQVKQQRMDPHELVVFEERLKHD